MRILIEEQRMADNKFLLVVIALAMVGPLILVCTKLFSDNTLETEELVGLPLFILIIALTMLMIFKLRIKLRLEEDKLIYNANPFSNKTKEIAASEIISAEVVKHNRLHGYGYKVTFSGATVYVMKPGKVLAIETRKGKKIRFGINRPKEVEEFIHKHWRNIY